MNSPTPTLRMGSTNSLNVERADSMNVSTPKGRELFSSPLVGGGGVSESRGESEGLPDYLKPVFMIDHGDGWEFVLKNATKTFPIDQVRLKSIY